MSYRISEDIDMLDFRLMSDEDIVELANSNNSQALDYLLYKYKNLVRLKARSYFLIGADRDDIIQEGMIGLYKAIRDYEKDRLSSFKSFAEICVKRQMITAIKSATRQKHLPLNFYISLNKPVYEEESDRTLLDIVSESNSLDPMDLFIGREDLKQMESKIVEMLSDFENDVLAAYIDGKTYHEIAKELDKDIKSVDNALQRVKKKLEKYLSDKE
ncbi:MAG: RNA polymerase sporulation sigma factor SigH [Tissierellia bacterium]|jgi:RNA polymerase sporulation-specific sigma factor|nr:RNA polymerase sporulation sigma factor SigH [Tissierellia bacterium]